MGENIRLAGVIRESVVDGPGWRFVVFTQGCPHKCEGCQNPQTHDFKGGYVSNTDRLMDAIKKDPILAGVTLSGGEPFMQAKPLAELAKEVHGLGLNVIAYSGFTYEELTQGANRQNHWMDLLKEVDLLVDGKFELSQKSLSLRFRGSRNQRVIDVKKSLEQQKAVETEFE